MINHKQLRKDTYSQLFSACTCMLARSSQHDDVTATLPFRRRQVERQTPAGQSKRRTRTAEWWLSRSALVSCSTAKKHKKCSIRKPDQRELSSDATIFVYMYVGGSEIRIFTDTCRNKIGPNSTHRSMHTFYKTYFSLNPAVVPVRWKRWSQRDGRNRQNWRLWFQTAFL